MTRRSVRLFSASLMVAGLSAGCSTSSKGTATSSAEPAGPIAEGRALLEQGQLDAALARLEQAPTDPQSLYLQGRVWSKKAETAPLPTPPPAASALPHGVAAPAAPEFKPEELRALELFERAVAAQPDNGQAHLAIAELLSPHAIRRHDREREAAAARGRRRGADVVAPAGDAGGVDFGADRIMRSYEFAAQADATGRAPADGLIAFGIRVGRPDAAEAGFRHLLQRVKEKPEPFIQYGNFLLEQKKDADAAIEQYRQALIWKPDDDATRTRIGDIYMARGAAFFGKQQFALADEQFKQAAKWIAPGSAQEVQLRNYQQRVHEIRMPAVR